MYNFQYSTLLFDVKSIFVFASIILILHFVRKVFSRNPKWVKFAKQLPGPYAYPLVGNSFDLLIGTRNGFTPRFKRYIKAYGKTFRLWIGNHLVVVISDPEDVQTVLLSSSCLGKSEMISPVTHEYFGDSIAFADIPVWRPKRRTFLPFFMKNALFTCIPDMNKLIYKHVDDLKTLVDGPEFDLKDMMIDLALETIMKTHLGYEVDKARAKELRVVFLALGRALENLTALTICYWKFLKMIFAVIISSDMAATKKITHNFVDEVLNSHKNSSNLETRSAMEREDENQVSETLAQSYLNCITKLEEEWGDEEIGFKELMVLFLAGTETTSETVCSCLFALGAHPDIQEKVYQEIYEVFGDDERQAEKSDLDNFPYLDQVMKETERLYTIIPIMFRNVADDTKIGNYIYPAGTTVMICSGAIHHNPEIYPNPDRFNPDNFSPEAISKRHKFSFIPFSAGARNCLGKPYAEITVKLRLIALLRTFSFYTTKKLEDIKMKPGFLETSAIGYPISIKWRKNTS